MGTRFHFGYNAKQAGKKAAKDMKDGKISKEELHEKYQDAKDVGQGEDFKDGYSDGAQEK